MFRYRENVAHGVKFVVEGGEARHTWDDWHIVPTERPTVATPQPNLNYISVPGSNYEIDVSEVVSGSITYGPREGAFEFAVINKEDWMWVNEEITNYLAGNRVRVVFDDDPDYFYEGRAWVEGYKPGSNYSTIVIRYHLGTFKRQITESLEHWQYVPYRETEGIL